MYEIFIKFKFNQALIIQKNKVIFLIKNVTILCIVYLLEKTTKKHDLLT